jgi:adenylate cyclase
MKREIERRFLVEGSGWKAGAPVLYRQAYLHVGPACVIRIRLEGDAAVLTVKGRPQGLARDEFAYPVPLEDARRLFAFGCGTVVEKWRRRIEFGGKWWDVDEFTGANAGLALAEIELECEEELFAPPPWLGEEVTHDARYLNARLAMEPYSTWK